MIKIVSLNIESDKHHDTVVPFLKSEAPDVVCLQEIFQKDLPLYKNVLGMKSFFKPICYLDTPNSGSGDRAIIGTAILTNLDAEFYSKYIFGDEKEIPTFWKNKNSPESRNNNSIVLLWSDIIDKDGRVYRIANTHFTWTPNGDVTFYQKEDTIKLISILDNELEQFVLVGDLNAPRGNGTFAMLEDKYKDNIPKEYDSSLDPKLHRVSGLKRMVDGFFSTKLYKVKNVKLIEGISDHKAVVGYIEKL